MKPLPLQPQGTMYVTKGGRALRMTQEEINQQREIDNIREEIQAERQAARIEANTRRLCRAILDSELTRNYPNFIHFVTEFIRGVDQNTVNPNIVYDHLTRTGNTCLQFVEYRCMHVVLRMYNLTRSIPPPELDTLRNFMINELAIRRNNKNKEEIARINSLDSSVIEKLIYSIERVANLSYTVLNTSISNDVTTLSQQALELSNECCDQLITIMDNIIEGMIIPRRTLNDDIKKILFEIVTKLHSISQDDDNLSKSIRTAGRLMFDRIIQQPWGAEYAKAQGYQVGGKGVNYNSLKKKSKNRSNRRIRRITFKRRSKRMYNSGNKKK